VNPTFTYSESPEMIQVKLELMNLQPDVIEHLPKGNVCVFAPHFDDEIIGCGGSVLKHHRENKDRVDVVYITDCAFRGRGDERREESKTVMKKLGIGNYRFLNLPERKFENTPENIKIFADTLEECSPKTIYLPFFFDAHRDHQMCNILLVSAMKKTKKKYRIFGYEVWALLPLNVVTDITKEFDEKMELIAMYKSQYDSCDYVNYTGGMNRVRARYLPAARGKAEGFFTLPSDEYIKLFEKAKL